MAFNELGSSRPMFTKTFHRDVYDFIDPTKPSLALPGKTVLVTGAGRGIGVSIVEAFAKAQVKTIILTGRTESSLAATTASFEKTYPSVQFISATVNVGEAEEVDALFASLKGKVDTIDIVVNNAGILNERMAKMGESVVERFNDAMSVNTRGPYLMARGQIHFNPPDHPATLINVTTGINEPIPNLTSYMLSKLPVVKMTELLDLEYPNLRTFAFLPGLVNTDLVSDFMKPYAQDKAPLSGALSVWLCSPQADFLSGRFMDGRWDMEEVVEKKEDIVKNNWLKLQIAGY